MCFFPPGFAAGFPGFGLLAFAGFGAGFAGFAGFGAGFASFGAGFAEGRRGGLGMGVLPFALPAFLGSSAGADGGIVRTGGRRRTAPR